MAGIYILHRLRGRGRVRHDRAHFDPLDGVSDDELKSRYRFDREGILYLKHLLERDLQRRTRRSSALAPIVQICAALRFYACGSFQEVIGDTLHISQPSLSRIVSRVTSLLYDLRDEFIYMPVDEELMTIKEEFYNVAGMPMVIGLIDGTHIKIQAPSLNEEVFVNRKQYHSINVQLVTDSRQLIRDCEARWPGSTHDSRILRNSDLYETFMANYGLNSLIMGDSGYPALQWLITPFLRPNTAQQRRYNRSHKTTRCGVERAIGVLKRTFNCLHQELRFKPDKCCQVIVACCVLHNIRKRLGIEDEDEDQQEEEAPAEHEDIAEPQAADNVGFARRLNIVENYF